jgi:hypothetical protein
MGIDRRTALGLIGIVATGSIGFAQKKAPSGNVAEERATAQKILATLKEAPQTVDSLTKLFPGVKPQALSAALESLVADETVDKWTLSKGGASWYMETDALSDSSDKILGVTTETGLRLSAITKAVPTLKPDVVRSLVQYLVEDEGTLRYVGAGSDNDPLVAKVQKARRGA